MLGAKNFIFNHFKHLQNNPPHSCLTWLLEAHRNHRKPCDWTEKLRCHIFYGGFFHSVIMLQLSDLSLVTVDFTLQAFNLLFVVIDFVQMMLL